MPLRAAVVIALLAGAGCGETCDDAACADATPTFDTFGQRCPPGGVTTWSYVVVHDGCSASVTEERCAAWWVQPESWDAMETAIYEVDGRCVELPGWNGGARYADDPRVLGYGADGCGSHDVPACAP